MMKKYKSIGHWKDSDNITCIASENSSDKNFRDDLKGNGFIPYVTFSQKKFEAFKKMGSYEIFEEVKKLTSNYRKWDIVSDYIHDCCDIIENRLNEI